MTTRPRPSRDAGSVTIWALACVVVVMFVGWMGLTAWSTFGERRELAAYADEAAQAGATALDLTLLRTEGSRQLDPTVAEARAWAALERQALAPLTVIDVDATPASVTVVLESEVDTGLLGALAGDDTPIRVRVTAIGRPREGQP